MFKTANRRMTTHDKMDIDTSLMEAGMPEHCYDVFVGCGICQQRWSLVWAQNAYGQIGCNPELHSVLLKPVAIGTGLMSHRTHHKNNYLQMYMHLYLFWRSLKYTEQDFHRPSQCLDKSLQVLNAKISKEIPNSLVYFWSLLRSRNRNSKNILHHIFGQY